MTFATPLHVNPFFVMSERHSPHTHGHPYSSFMGCSSRAQAIASRKRSSRQIIPATLSPTNSPHSTRSMNPLATHHAEKGDDNSPIPDIDVKKSDGTTEYVLQHVPSRKRRKVVTVVSSSALQALAAQSRYIEVIPEKKTVCTSPTMR